MISLSILSDAIITPECVLVNVHGSKSPGIVADKDDDSPLPLADCCLLPFFLFKEVQSLENISSIPDIELLLPKIDCFPTNISLLPTLSDHQRLKNHQNTNQFPPAFFFSTCAYMHVHMTQLSHTNAATVVVSAEDGSLNKTSS